MFRFLPLVVALSLVGCGATPPEPASLAARTEPVAVLSAPVDEVAPAPAQPEPTEASPPPPRRLTIGAGGDVIVHLKVARSAAEYADEGGFDRVFETLGGVVSEEEVAFVNLETPLSDRIPAETGDPPVLGAPASVAAALARAGIDAASVANNHSYDQTASGLGDTVAALEAAEIASVGASADTNARFGPRFVERPAGRVAFVATTERVNRGPLARGDYTQVARYDEEALFDTIRAARESADIVVLSIHWSHDFYETPTHTQREKARRLVDAGVDLIVGHGPHVLQTVERFDSPRGQALVAYSLGNLLSNQALRYRPGRRINPNIHPAVVLPQLRDGAWLRVGFRVEEDGQLAIDAVEAVPLWTENNFLAVAYDGVERLSIRIRRLEDMPASLYEERIGVIGQALGGEVAILND